jgi:hypothetical protein
MLVERIVDELQDKDDDANQGICGGETPNKPDDIPSNVGENEEDEESDNEVFSPVCAEAQPSLSVGTLEESRDQNLRSAGASQVPETQVNPSICNTPKEDGSAVGNLHRCTRVVSCPPSANRHALPGPWS